MRNESKLIWESFSNSKDINFYIENILFDSKDLVIEEGIGDFLKGIGRKVAGAAQKFNPNELYRKAYANILTKRSQLEKASPKAAKLFQIASNGRNIKLAMMATALLGTIAGMGPNEAQATLEGLPEFDQGFEDILNQAAPDNLANAQDSLQGTNFDPETLASKGLEVDFHGLDDYLGDLVQSGTIDQAAADQILNCVAVDSALDMGEFLEGINIQTFDTVKTQLDQTITDSYTQVSGQEEFLSRIKTTVTGKNGQEIVVADLTTGYKMDPATGDMQAYERTGGLRFDINRVLSTTIEKLPQEQQDKIWDMVIERGDMSLGTGDEFGGLGSNLSKFKQFNPNSNQVMQDIPGDSKPRIGGGMGEDREMWGRYIRENKQQAVAKLQQEQQQYLNGLNNLGKVMAERAKQKGAAPGTKIPFNQL